MIISAYRFKNENSDQDIYLITEQNSIALISKEEYNEINAIKPEIKSTEQESGIVYTYIIEMNNFPKEILRKYAQKLLETYYKKDDEPTELLEINIKYLEELVFKSSYNSAEYLEAKMNLINEILLKEIEESFKEVVKDKLQDPNNDSRLKAIENTKKFFKTTYFKENETQIGMSEIKFSFIIDQISNRMMATDLK